MSALRTRQRVAQKKKGQPVSSPVGPCAPAYARNFVRLLAVSRNPVDAAVAAPYLLPLIPRAVRNSPVDGCSRQPSQPQLPSFSAACTGLQSRKRWPQMPAQTTQTPPAAHVQRDRKSTRLNSSH